jgi:hypothetical protein
MSDAHAPKGLRERLAGSTEDRLGRALTDLFENPLLNGALGRASDAREKAAQAQELAMGALNLPSAADIERLTRRLRSVSQRLEGIEDGVHRIGRSLSTQSLDGRLEAIEEQLRSLAGKLDGGPAGDVQPSGRRFAADRPSAKASTAKVPSAKVPSAKASAAKASAAKASAATASSEKRPSARGRSAKAPSTKRSSGGRPSAKGPSA